MHLGKGSQPCPFGQDPWKSPFLLLPTQQKNHHLILWTSAMFVIQDTSFIRFTLSFLARYCQIRRVYRLKFWVSILKYKLIQIFSILPVCAHQERCSCMCVYIFRAKRARASYALLSVAPSLRWTKKQHQSFPLKSAASSSSLLQTRARFLLNHTQWTHT